KLLARRAGDGIKDCAQRLARNQHLEDAILRFLPGATAFSSFFPEAPHAILSAFRWLCLAYSSQRSISRRRLYLARRSERVMEPILIWPAPEATARSARNPSSVSPERAEMTAPKPASRARSITAKVWVMVPIWFILTRTAFAAPSRMPRLRRSR